MFDKHTEVQRMLVLSTVHISPEADRLLKVCWKGEHLCPLSHDPVSYGWLIWVSLEDIEIHRELQDWARGSNLQGLAECLERARSMKCEWLKLDGDAGADAILPVFDWD